VVRKNTLYSAAMFGWGILVFGATVAVFSGKAAPLVTVEMIPISGPFSLFAFAGGLFVIGAIVVGKLRKRAWKRAGRQANLRPEGGGLIGSPDMVGTENGRTVRARTIKRRTSSGGGESGSSKSTFTIVEADLGEPPESGMVITRSDGEGLDDIGSAGFDLETDSVGEFDVITRSPELTDAILTERARGALRRMSRSGAVFVGDAADVVLEAVPDGDGMITGMVTDKIESKMKEKMGDSDAVSIETKGPILDSEEMEAQIAAVAAVADEFERATGR